MSTLIETAQRWVSEKYPYNHLHLLQSLVWLDRVSPQSREAVRLATLTHDMERAFPGADPLPSSLDDVEYYKAHCERSAKIVGAWLREQGAGETLAADVEELVRVHEFGGWAEANLVQAADSLSFLEVNVELFVGFIRSGKFTVGEVRRKFQWMFDRMQVDAARRIARPMLAGALVCIDAADAALVPAGGR